jgi:hypothetical protein
MNYNFSHQFKSPKTHSDLEKFWGELLDKLADVLDTTKTVNQHNKGTK